MIRAKQLVGLLLYWDGLSILRVLNDEHKKEYHVKAQQDTLVTRDGGQTWVWLVSVLPNPAKAPAISPENELTLWTLWS